MKLNKLFSEHILNFAFTSGSSDHLPTMHALLKSVENALSSFSLGDRSGSARLPMIPILLNLVRGILYPTFRATPVWHELRPFRALISFIFKSLWITATPSYLNSARA